MTSPEQERDAGFTLIEIVIVAAIFAVVTFVAFELLRQSQNVVRHVARRHGDALELHRFADRLRAEALSATAIMVTASTRRNPPDPCTEIEFFFADPAGNQFWSYRTTGNTVLRLAAAGPILPCVAGAGTQTVLSDITAFDAASYAVSELPAHVDPIGGALDSPFINPSAPLASLDAHVDLHVKDAAQNEIYGGNEIVEVRVDGRGASYVVDVTPGVKPSGYQKILAYPCGARGGCAPATLDPTWLSHFDVATCATGPGSGNQPYGIVYAVPSSAQGSNAYTTAPCPSGPGACFYVRYWDVQGVVQYALSGKDGTKTYPEYWEIASFATPGNPNPSDLVTSGSAYPAFTHQAEAYSAAFSQASNAALLRTHRDACGAIAGEEKYQNI